MLLEGVTWDEHAEIVEAPAPLPGSSAPRGGDRLMVGCTVNAGCDVTQDHVWDALLDVSHSRFASCLPRLFRVVPPHIAAPRHVASRHVTRDSLYRSLARATGSE